MSGIGDMGGMGGVMGGRGGMGGMGGLGGLGGMMGGLGRMEGMAGNPGWGRGMRGRGAVTGGSMGASSMSQWEAGAGRGTNSWRGGRGRGRGRGRGAAFLEALGMLPQRFVAASCFLSISAFSSSDNRSGPAPQIIPIQQERPKFEASLSLEQVNVMFYVSSHAASMIAECL